MIDWMTDWMTDGVSFLPFLAIVFVVALSGAVFMPGRWYEALQKPSWTPPNWLFAPAWTVLYVMIAISGWLVWQAQGFGPALAVWSLNLAFNGAWSWLMFGRHDIRAALFDAVGMLLTILGFIALTWQQVPTAAWLFAPYLAWVVFATALNASILIRNPDGGRKAA